MTTKDNAKALEAPKSKKLNASQLEEIKREIGLIRFTAETMLKVCDNLDERFGHVRKSRKS